MAEPELTREESEFIARGFGQWGGPAAPTDGFAQELGYADVASLRDGIEELRHEFMSGEHLSAEKWALILRLTHAIVTDDQNGAGWEWPIVTGYSDTEPTALLAAIRRKLGPVSNA